MASPKDRMLQYIVAMSDANHNVDTKPWVISSPGDILRGKIRHKENIEEYKEECPFPGVTSSMEAKMEWIKEMNEHHMDNLFSLIAEPSEAAYEILMENAPEKIRLDVIVDKKNLEESLKFENKEEEQLFLKNVSKYVPTHLKYSDKKGSGSVEECKQWLCNNAQIPSRQPSVSGEKILFASLDCSRDDEIRTKLVALSKDLGIHSFSEFEPLKEESVNRAGWNPFECEKIGQCMYSGYDEKDVTNPKDGSIHYRIKVNFDMTGGSSAMKNPKEKEFDDAMEEQSKKFTEVGDKRMCLLVKKKNATSEENDSDDDEDDESIPVIAENYDILWLPDAYREHKTRIRNHLTEGEGECVEYQQRLQKGNTDSGNITIEMFNQELSYCRKLKNLRERFGAILALTEVAAFGFSFWIDDNEYYEECGKIFRSLATLWKTLLKHDDAALGFGLPGEEVKEEDGKTESRQLLYTQLGKYAEALKGHECIKTFNWKPAQKEASAAKRKIDERLQQVARKVQEEKKAKKAK